ncbi:MAG: type IV secretion protein IcmD [Gammaproteobacteria bacterium]|nr:type IV secretion protein IcmD [Gammaproteobacteria bacterium]
MHKNVKKSVILFVGALACFSVGTVAFAAASGTAGIGSIASNVTGNLTSIAKLITALSYVMGMAMAVASIVKFKAHKDNPTQVPIGTPIALLFVAAALIFVPSVFKTSGATLFGGSGEVAGASGIASFGAKTAGS